MRIARYNAGTMVYLSDAEKAVVGGNINLVHVEGKGITVYGDSSGAKLHNSSSGRSGAVGNWRALLSKNKLPRDWGLWGAEEVYSKIVDDARYGKVILANEPKRKTAVGEQSIVPLAAKERLAKERLDRAIEAHSPARFESPKVHQTDNKPLPPLQGSATSPLPKQAEEAMLSAIKSGIKNPLVTNIPVTPPPTQVVQPPSGMGLEKATQEFLFNELDLKEIISDLNYIKRNMKDELVLTIKADGTLRAEVMVIKTFD